MTACNIGGMGYTLESAKMPGARPPPLCGFKAALCGTRTGMPPRSGWPAIESAVSSVRPPAYGVLTDPRGFVGSPVGRHAVLQYCSGPKLSVRERRSNAVIAVIGGPVKLVMEILVPDGILCLIPGDVDECKGLAHQLSRFPLPAGMGPFISARAALPLSSARGWSRCRMAITIVLTCGMARFSLSGRVLCTKELAFRLSDLYAFYSAPDIWCIS